MGSLKEIKNRIQSVKSTQKITSAMKMVSSTKLRKAEKIIESIHPYESRLSKIMIDFLSGGNDLTSVYATRRELSKVALVVFSSNSSLCGSFNSNVAKHLDQKVYKYNSFGKDNILIYPVGKKIATSCKTLGLNIQGDYQDMADKPTMEQAFELADELMRKFKNKEFDRVELIYHTFVSKSTQKLIDEFYLPIQLLTSEHGSSLSNYILEPSGDEILENLIPNALRYKIYTALLDSNASEHAARTMAMQVATDNANDLLQELSLQYNKSRQQAITNELLDIMGGSF